MNFRFYVFLALANLIFAAGVLAQDQGDGSLHVLRPSIDAERDDAEICLEFDHPLEMNDRAKLAAAIRLKNGSKTVGNLAQNINVTANLLCIEGLEHKRHYDLSVNGVHGAKGEKLTGSYALSFVIPDRHPSLAFAGDSNSGGVTHYKDGDPVLRAINIDRATIELYRLSDLNVGAQAWQQRMQTSLAPSESLTFARDKGQLLWRGDMVLDNGDDENSANQTIEKTVPLHAATGELSPGLYFIAAKQSSPLPKKSADAPLPPIAAQWFLRSDLRVRAFPSRDGFYAVTENANGAVVKDVSLAINDASGQILSQAQSDENGIALLSIAADKRVGATVLTATTTAGDVDFVSLTAAPDIRFLPPGLTASMQTDRSFYRPGSTVVVALGLRDIHDAAMAMTGTRLIVLRPNSAFYATVPVPEAETGVAYVSFSAPANEGKWSIEWQQNDGHKLATLPLLVTTNKNAPHIDAKADRTALGDDGEFNLSLKSLTNDGFPALYVDGHVFLRWRARNSLPDWPDYIFGANDDDDEKPTEIASFLTDGTGSGALHLTLKLPENRIFPHEAEISIVTDPAAGAENPAPLMLPLAPMPYMVGLKPLAPHGQFTEDSMARFDVIAVDGKGKRQSADDLSYEVYEEGRRFEWYQADGRWDYKPQQQRRRIGGGALSIKTSGSTISWPVTAGSYTLEIEDASGTVIARAHAEAGWNLLPSEPAVTADLPLEGSTPTAHVGEAYKINFTLDKPAMVSAIVADDRIRQIIHEAMPAGKNTIIFSPTEDWGLQVGVRVEARSEGALAVGKMVVPVELRGKDLIITATTPSSLSPGQDIQLPLALSNVAFSQPTHISVLATPVPDTESDNSLIDSFFIKGITADRDGKALLHLTVPAFDGNLRLKIVAANQDQYGEKEMVLPTHKALTAELAIPPVLRANDVLRTALILKNNDPIAGSFHYVLSLSPRLGISADLHDTFILASGKTKSIPLTLRTLNKGEQEIKLEIAGPHSFHDSRSWSLGAINARQEFRDQDSEILAPQKDWTSVPSSSPHIDNQLLFLSPAPLFDLPQLLETLLDTEPFTTGEIASWLEAVRLWRETIIASGFLSQHGLDKRREEIFSRLIKRQKSNGSFPDLPDGDGDIASTSQALVAIARSDSPMAHPVADLAAGWLHDKLQNTWFEEQERPERAAAFAALAISDRLDVATLRYFDETSAAKKLPAVSAAQLAAALIKSNDIDRAKFWLKTAREAQEPNAPATLDLLSTLAKLPIINPHDLLPDTQKRAEEWSKKRPHDVVAIAQLLEILSAVEGRLGAWHAVINSRESDQAGVFVTSLPEKDLNFVIHNPSDAPLYILTEVLSTKASSDALKRRIFQLDGTEVIGGGLEKDNVYLLDIEGNSPEENDKPLFLHDGSGAGLKVITCAIDADIAKGSWEWLETLDLTPIISCEPSSTSIDAIVEASGAWHVAYLVQAEWAGSFGLGSTTARAASGQEWMMTTSANSEIQIK